LAQRHAARVHELAEKHGSPYLRVFALTASGIARAVGKDFAGAIRDFDDCLVLARSAKAALEYEPETLASLADCYYATGEFNRAIAFAKEAIGVARERSARLAECRASITCAVALLGRDGAAQLGNAEALLGQAEHLIARSGAKIYEPLLERGRDRISSMLVS
jgi:adenylate cyclase